MCLPSLGENCGNCYRCRDLAGEISGVRDAIASADEHRRQATSAESVRGRIADFGNPVAIKRGWFGTRSGYDYEPTYQFTEAETDAIYAALEVIRDDNLRRADEIEQCMAAQYLRDGELS